MRKRLALIASGISLLLGLVLIPGLIFCKATLQVSRRALPDPNTLQFIGDVKAVRMTARDNSNLTAWFIRTRASNHACVIVLHGIADSRAGSAGFAGMFLEAGYSVLLPDSRGHGESGGDSVTYGFLEKYDVVDWAKWLTSEGCEAIYGLGESLGGAILIQAAGTGPMLRAVVAECAYSDLWSIATYRVKQWLGRSVLGTGAISRWLVFSGLLVARLRYGLNLDTVSPLKSISETKTPILLIHGTEDENTPPDHSIALAAASQHSALWLVPGAGHTGAAGVAPIEFRSRVLKWFASH